MRVICEFIELGAKAKEAATEAMDTEAVLGEIPDEYLDPIQVCFKPLSEITVSICTKPFIVPVVPFSVPCIFGLLIGD